MQKLCIHLATDEALVQNQCPSTRRWRNLSVRLTARKDVRRKPNAKDDAVVLLFCENCNHKFHTEQAFEPNVVCPICKTRRKALPNTDDDAANAPRGSGQAASSSSSR